MRVGVTGAGGYVGRALVRRLREAGHAVTALLLPGEPEPAGVTAAVRGDVRDPGAMGHLAGASDAVVHAAAYVHRAADSAQARAECFAVNEGGARNLVAALEATGRRPHLVLISSTAVYGNGSDGAAEDAVLRPVTAYGHSKLAAERLVLDAAARGTVTGCVLRPAVVFGAGAPGNTARLAGLIRRGWVPRVDGGTNRKSMVHVDDLTAAIAACVAAPEHVNGRVYNVAGPPVTVAGMVEALARGAGARFRWVPVPRALGAAGAGLTRTASRLTAGALPDLSGTFEAFAGEATVDAAAIARDLGLSFRDTAAALEAMQRAS